MVSGCQDHAHDPLDICQKPTYTSMLHLEE